MNAELEITLINLIKETYSESVSLATMARGHAMEAVKKAIRCGQYLIEAKTMIGHGGFVSWVNANFGQNATHMPHLDIRTAQRYMRLAETPIEELQDAYSIRQAYIAAGILDKSWTKTEPINRDPEGTNWIPVLDKINIRFAELLDARPLSHWDEDEKAILRERSRPVAMIFVQAGGKL